MGWWKADPVPEATPRPPPPPAQKPSIPHSESSCPVDEKTRSIWLQQAKAKATSQQPNLPSSHPPIPPQQPPHRPQPPPPSSSTLPTTNECSSSTISQSPNPPTSTIPTRLPLSLDRQTSSIPRSIPHDTASPTSAPANSETETGPHQSGNWIYPSETQFYHAIMRKNSLTSSTPDQLLSSISHIIPIHNAVNERAWHLISAWEKPYNKCVSGPKLQSFHGLGAGALSPRAKWNSWVLGYTEPFDRHDWVVERCDGRRVDYVIDFYQGKDQGDVDGRGSGRGGRENLNFYLDVRPKLNSWEGVRARVERGVGLK